MMDKKNAVVDPWIALNEVAEYIGCNYYSVHKFVYKYGLPVYKVGNRYRGKCSEIDEWIRSGKAADTTKKNAKSGRKIKRK